MVDTSTITLCTLILVALMVSTPPAVAGTPIPVGFDDLAKQAEFVVVGRVTDQNAKYNDHGTMILTYSTIEVEQVLAGDAPSSFEVAEYGGRVGNRGMVSTGQVVFEKGEHVLLFICRDALELLRTCGAIQGRMRVSAVGGDGSLRAEGQMAGKTVRESLSGIRVRIESARESSR